MGDALLPLDRDLRRATAEAKRFHDHTSKWAIGNRTKCTDEEGTPILSRPAKQRGSGRSHINTEPRCRPSPDVPVLSRGRVHPAEDTSYALGEENWPPPGANAAGSARGPDKEAGIVYSFDAPRGPGRGTHILGIALDRAVVAFENKEVQRLAKEYEFVEHDVDSVDHGPSTDEDDYEVINPPKA